MTRVGHVEFNYIYILQSLAPGERRTGSDLHAQKIDLLVKALSKGQPAVGAEVIDVEDASELHAVLERIRMAVEREGRFPVVHMEIHGSSDKKGLFLQSGEFVAWEGLIEPLTRLNRQMRNNLLLTLAVCSGAYLASILNAAREAPFWGLVGPDRSEWDGELFAGFAAFYEAFLTTLDGGKAVAALRAATAATGEAAYLFLNAEELFRNAFRAYVEQACNPAAVDERVDRIMEEAKKKGTLPPGQLKSLAANIRAKMSDPRPAFERYRKVFFMIDACPENDARFPMTFDEVMSPK